MIKSVNSGVYKDLPRVGMLHGAKDSTGRGIHKTPNSITRALCDSVSPFGVFVEDV